MPWNSLASSYAVGRMAPVNGAAQGDVVALPRLWKRDGSRPAILAFHGAGGTARHALAMPTLTGQYWTYRNLAALTGCPVIAHDFGGAFTWGRKASIDAVVDEVIDYAEGPNVGAAGPHIFMGASMGGLSIAQYCKDHVAQTAACVGLIPVSDLDDVRNFDRGSSGFRASINAIYGLASGSTSDYPTHGTSFAALPAGANPTTSPGSLASVPCRAYYASNDAICIAATVVNLWQTILGGEAIDVGALGHTEAAIGAVIMGPLVDWLREVEAV